MSQTADLSVQAIKEAVPAETISAADQAGVDVDSVIEDKITQHGDYSLKTVARIVKSDLDDQIEAAKADELQGIIMGSRDRYGSRAPRRWSLVRSNGEHTQVSTWDGELDGPDGAAVEIPRGGAVVTLRCSWDEQYEDWQGKRIEAVREMGPTELVEALEAVAIPPSSITRDDANSYEVVVVKAPVAFVNPQTVFAGDDKEDWYDGEVMMENERGELLPHLELSLDTDDAQYQVRGHFDRQAYGRPYIQVPDFEKLCHDAVRHRDSPENQARFVQDGIRGEDVILVGAVTGFNTDRDDESGDVIHYIDIGMSALVSTGDTVQTGLEDAASVDGEPEPEPASPEPPEPDVGDTDVIAEVRASIEQYCELTGTDIGSLTVDDVNEKIKGIDAPDVAIRQALGGDTAEAESEEADESGPEDVHGYDDLPFDPNDHTVSEVRDLLDDVEDVETLVNLDAAENAGKDRKTAKEAINSRANELGEAEDEDVGDDGFEPDPDADDPWESIHDEETGLYHCPADDCLASAGSTGEIAAHAFDDHDISGDPAEWVRSQVGA